MCKPASLSSEYRRWVEQPFISGSVTPATRTGGRFESLTCMHCGSVVICGGTKLHNATARGRRFFCDIECANEYKKWHNRTEDYKATIGWHEIRQNRTEEEEQKRLNSWVCCSLCGRAFQRIMSTQVCCQSKSCLKNKRAVEKRAEYECDSGLVVCIWCGEKKWFKHAATRRKFCGIKCARKHTKLNRAYRKRSNGHSESIGLVTLAKKYKFRCCACNVKCIKPMGLNLDNEATMDHVIPLSKGGTHQWSNVQLLCRKCNWMKNDVIVEGTQLWLSM